MSSIANRLERYATAFGEGAELKHWPLYITTSLTLVLTLMLTILVVKHHANLPQSEYEEFVNAIQLMGYLAAGLAFLPMFYGLITMVSEWYYGGEKT